MNSVGILSTFILVICINVSYSQLPPRLNIPGAVLVGSKPNPILRQRLQQLDPIPRSRPRIQNAIPVPVREVRPVVEEPEEEPQQNTFEDEVNKLGISNLQGAGQQVEEEPQPVPFRPERPLPVLRQDIRESPRPQVQQKSFPRPAPQRQEYEAPVQQVRRPAPQPIRQQAQPARQAPARVQSRPAPQYLEDEPTRPRKPPVQILRKYRTDNADGSITWGYENEDGSFKEETIGNDCITRGKYGYVDPEGVRREYSYETGGKCEDPDPEELAQQIPQQQPKAGKKPYRLPAQY